MATTQVVTQEVLQEALKVALRRVVLLSERLTDALSAALEYAESKGAIASSDAIRSAYWRGVNDLLKAGDTVTATLAKLTDDLATEGNPVDFDIAVQTVRKAAYEELKGA